MNVYETSPQYGNGKFTLRLTDINDADDLLKVYGDIKAVPFFNGDNCHGDDFYYTTKERMIQALNFWQEAYEKGWFVRLTVWDNECGAAVGTIEEFRRDADDYFTDCGLLRLDLRSDYETCDVIQSILSLIVEPSFEMFGCSKIATKAFPNAAQRIKALESFGFVKTDEPLIGHDGTKYYDYCVFER